MGVRKKANPPPLKAKVSLINSNPPQFFLAPTIAGAGTPGPQDNGTLTPPSQEQYRHRRRSSSSAVHGAVRHGHGGGGGGQGPIRDERRRETVRRGCIVRHQPRWNANVLQGVCVRAQELVVCVLVVRSLARDADAFVGLDFARTRHFWLISSCVFLYFGLDKPWT